MDKGVGTQNTLVSSLASRWRIWKEGSGLKEGDILKQIDVAQEKSSYNTSSATEGAKEDTLNCSEKN